MVFILSHKKDKTMGFEKGWWSRIFSYLILGFCITEFIHPCLISAAEKTGTAALKKATIRYRPPMRGAPVRRVGGGTRGADDTIPFIAALAPDDTGFTISKEPVLYFYMAFPWEGQVMFSLVEAETLSTVIETQINVNQSGILGISLKDLKVSLETGVEYEWYVALVPDTENRSLDVITTGAVKRIQADVDLADKLSAAPLKPHFVYAEQGLWYDAIDAINKLIDKHPGDKTLREERISLLEQVGLKEVATYEKQLLTK